jgi:cold shock CspA family protein/Txe/YoeB family toxin of Txe-Axe toxin-antitoxin module
VIRGPALKSATDGFAQAAGYCLEHGVDFAALTTGQVWVAFIALQTTGKSFREYKAIVFPNLEAIQDDFGAFYDLFSKEGVRKKLYRTHFAKLEGISDRQFEPLVSVNRAEESRLLGKSDLARELEPVLSSFFSDLSGENDPELRRQCFVETRESRTADITLKKMINSISSSITAIPTDTGKQIVERIETVMQTGRSENILIAGGEGAGKSTFVTRFFEDILDRQLRSNCVVVRVDLSDIVDDPGSAPAKVTGLVQAEIERQLFAGGYPKYDDLQGLYFDEYQRWSEGQHKALYESDKDAFKIKFGDFLDQALRSDPFSYISRILKDVVSNRKLLPILVFDNADSRSEAFQEAVFEWSQTLKRQISLCLVLIPVSDRTIWRMSRDGPLRVKDGKIFYLPTPSTKDVLQKRIAYLIDHSKPKKGSESYFLSKGITLKLADINAFAACMEEIFITEDFISRRIGWLTNHNLFRSLELTRDTITSPYLSIDELVATYLTRNGSTQPIKHRKFMQALIGGDYNQFDGEKHGYVRNVFETSSDFPSSPLLTLSIIKMLIDKAGEEATNSTLGYVTYENMRSYFGAMNVSDDALRDAIARSLTNGLIEPFQTGDFDIAEHQRFGVTSPGRMHYEMALGDGVYVGQMAFATPVRSLTLVDRLRAIKAGVMQSDQWRDVARLFMDHCLNEDRAFLNQPQDPMFSGQVQLRADLRARWVDATISSRQASIQAIGQPTTSIRDRVRATVKWFDHAKAYGFLADPSGGQDIFVAMRLFHESMLEVPKEGATIVCDVGPGKNDKPQAIKLHSIEPVSVGSDAPFVPATLKFYDPEKGFGFATANSTNGDVYVPRWLVEQSGSIDLSPGAAIEIVIQQNAARGAMASELRSPHRGPPYPSGKR